MYYDVPNRIGTVLDADMLTPVPKYDGLLRLHAQILQQVSPERMLAHDAFFTSSRLGVPAYRMQTRDVTFDDVPHPLLDPLDGRAADRSGHRRADRRARPHGDCAQRRALPRRVSHLLLAGHGHRSQRALATTSAASSSRTTASSARKSARTSTCTSCWACRSRPRAPTGTSASITSATAASPTAPPTCTTPRTSSASPARPPD